MKILQIFFIVLFSQSLLMAIDCADIVIPASTLEPIENCCIDDIKNGNMVHFTKNGESYAVEAISVVRNGKTDELAISGIMAPVSVEGNTSFLLAIAEYGLNTQNLLLQANKAHRPNLTMGKPQATSTFFVFNIMTAFKVGLPIWRSGNEIKVDNKYVKAENVTNMKLSLGKTLHGAGLNFRF